MAGFVITYRLPVSCARIVGVIEHLCDTVLDSEESRPTATVALEVMADDANRSVTVKDAFLRSTNITLEMTEDRRLVSTSVESVGEAGRVAVGLISAVASVAGAFVGIRPFAAMGGLAELFPARGGAPGEPKEKELPPEQKVAAAYQGSAGGAGLLVLKQQCSSTVLELTKEAADTAAQMAAEREPSEVARLLRRLSALEEALAVTRAELERLERHFAAWRATTIRSRSEDYDCVLTLDELLDAPARVTTDGNLILESDGSPQWEVGNACRNPQARAKAQDVCARLGVVITVDPIARPARQQTEEGTTAPATTETPTTTETPGTTETRATPVARANQVVVRIPRTVRLTLHKRVSPTAFVRVQSRPYLVVDRGCDLDVVPFRESWFGKKTAALSFSASGVLVGFSSGATASAADVAETVASLPAAVAAGLEQSGKIQGQFAALRSQAADGRILQVKREVELKQQELALAGLDATEAGYAELARMKQEIDLLEARKALGLAGAVPDSSAIEVAALKQELELLKVRQDMARVRQDAQ